MQSALGRAGVQTLPHARPDLATGRNRRRSLLRPAAQRGPEARERLKEVDDTLKQLGVDRQTAKKVLKVWRQAGIDDPEALKRMISKRGADKSMAVSVQLAVDAFSAGIAWWTALQISQTRAFGPFTLAAEYLVFTLALYNSINASLDAFSLVAVGLATRRYSSNAAVFLEAIQALAGPESGLQVVDKARRAVLTVKILSALDQILGALKDGAAAADPANFFRDLSAFLVLQRAAERSGFDPGTLGVTPAEAADIAASFGEVDADDDGLLDAAEFRQLCARYAPQLSAEEADAAMTVLDTNKDGGVDFGEWLTWWVSKGTPQAEQAEPDEQVALAEPQPQQAAAE